MYLILVIFVLAAMIYANSSYNVNIRYLRNNTCTIVTVVFLIFLVAFRSSEVGTDTLSYMEYYSATKYWDWSDIFSERFEAYIVYYILNKCFQMMSLPCEVLFGFVGTLYLISIYLLIKRWSKDPLLGILIFITNGLFMFSLAGMKQVLAMSFILFSFLAFVDKRWITCVIFFLLGYYSHPTVAVFLFGYVLYLIRNKKWMWIVTLIILAIILSSGPLVLSTMVEANGLEHFGDYIEELDSSYSYATLIFYVITLGIAMIGQKRYHQLNLGESNFTLSCCLMACALQSLAAYSPSTFRLAYLYTPFYMIYTPNSILTIKSPTYRNAVYVTILFCYIFYFLYAGRNNTYSFIWQ